MTALVGGFYECGPVRNLATQIAREYHTQNTHGPYSKRRLTAESIYVEFKVITHSFSTMGALSCGMVVDLLAQACQGVRKPSVTTIFDLYAFDYSMHALVVKAGFPLGPDAKFPLA